jgi:hypothetical protein
LWWWVGGLFLLMACAWTAMFFFAGRAHVESVPLAAPETRETEAR